MVAIYMVTLQAAEFDAEFDFVKECKTIAKEFRFKYEWQKQSAQEQEGHQEDSGLPATDLLSQKESWINGVGCHGPNFECVRIQYRTNWWGLDFHKVYGVLGYQPNKKPKYIFVPISNQPNDRDISWTKVATTTGIGVGCMATAAWLWKNR